MTVTTAKKSDTYCDRLLLELHRDQSNPVDYTLADGLDGAGAYLSELGLIGGDFDRPGVIGTINGMGLTDASTIVNDQKPEYKGRFRVLFADGKIGGSVTLVHAQTPLYEME